MGSNLFWKIILRFLKAILQFWYKCFFHKCLYGENTEAWNGLQNFTLDPSLGWGNLLLSTFWWRSFFDNKFDPKRNHEVMGERYDYVFECTPKKLLIWASLCSSELKIIFDNLPLHCGCAPDYLKKELKKGTCLFICLLILFLGF